MMEFPVAVGAPLSQTESLYVHGILGLLSEVASKNGFRSDFIVRGSVAMMLRVQSIVRPPDDLDLMLCSPSKHKDLLDSFDSTVKYSVTRVADMKFDGHSGFSGIQTVIEQREGNRSVVRFRVEMPFLTAEDRAAVEYGVLSEAFDLQIETLPSLIAAKVHALFRIRSSTSVSMRWRDLYDLEVLRICGLLPDRAEVTMILQQFEGGLAPRQDPPIEWRGPWSKLRLQRLADIGEVSDAWRNVAEHFGVYGCGKSYYG